MQTPGSPRITWSDLPVLAQRGINALLGSDVVTAAGQHGGFSPGTADRVLLADGRRAFVKAVSHTLNPHSPDLHRQEARVAEVLPRCAAVPEFFGAYDDGEWVALAFADVEGRHAAVPWQEAEVQAVLQALDDVVESAARADLGQLPKATDALTDDVGGWQRLQSSPAAHLPAMAEERLDLLVTLALRAPAALAGTHLCHGDIRADNVLMKGDRAVLVDWPWASIGPAWFDPALLVLNVALNSGDDAAVIDHWMSRTPALRDANPDHLDAFLAGLAGYFFDAARQPTPPGLPTIREFQRAQGEVVLRWLQRRMNW